MGTFKSVELLAFSGGEVTFYFDLVSLFLLFYKWTRIFSHTFVLHLAAGSRI